jgi:type IV secretion system protein VirB10
MRLRPDPPAVARLSRKVIVGLAAAASALAASVAGWSLTHRRAPVPEGEPPAAAAPPDAVTALPKDYASPPREVPKLGPPLPGDLGRPLLAAAREDARSSAAITGPAADPAAQAAADAVRQAHGSALFAPASVSPAPERAARALAGEGPVGAGATAAATPPDRKAEPADAGPSFVLQAGAVIPAALVTGLRSDLPGMVVAQVTSDVFDSATGRHRLIPQGARLLGAYDAASRFGQARVNLAWDRLVLPDGRSVDLGKAAATDPQGFEGLQDRVERNWRGLAGSALVSTLLGVGAGLGVGGGDGELAQALRFGTASAANQVGQALVGRSIAIAPRLTIRPGFEVRALVTRSLALPEWREP